MKKAGIVLLAIQALALFGSIVSGEITSVFSGNIAYLIGYFLPTIIGVILLVKASKKAKQNENNNA
jgi:hypothetical protein